MKATIDIPDDLYRQIKSEAALRGLTIREVTTQLYRRWLSEDEGAETREAPQSMAALLAGCGRRSAQACARGPFGEGRAGRRPEPVGSRVTALVIDASVWVSAADATDGLSESSRSLSLPGSGTRAPDFSPGAGEAGDCLRARPEAARRRARPEPGRSNAGLSAGHRALIEPGDAPTGPRGRHPRLTALRGRSLRRPRRLAGCRGRVVGWGADRSGRGFRTPTDWIERNA